MPAASAMAGLGENYILYSGGVRFIHADEFSTSA
jgi:hypothetical protein